MTSLESFLTEVALERYLPALQSQAAIVTVDQLQTLDENAINDVTTKAGMLKGHAMKFKKRVEELKSGNLTVMKKTTAPTSAPVPVAAPAVSAIQTETNLLALKLNEIE